MAPAPAITAHQGAAEADPAEPQGVLSRIRRGGRRGGEQRQCGAHRAPQASRRRVERLAPALQGGDCGGAAEAWEEGRACKGETAARGREGGDRGLGRRGHRADRGGDCGVILGRLALTWIRGTPRMRCITLVNSLSSSVVFIHSNA